MIDNQDYANNYDLLGKELFPTSPFSWDESGDYYVICNSKGQIEAWIASEVLTVLIVGLLNAVAAGRSLVP